MDIQPTIRFFSNIRTKKWPGIIRIESNSNSNTQIDSIKSFIQLFNNHLSTKATFWKFDLTNC
ncbi:hypothetical protein MJO28_008820 [Puccinia striiformis f. sp. tritici]|uniref:Uncharacterized protein n=1 Tax=Puccinia striiformis f. sp. tritici TaxID=168172 RepID=A0ACC0EC83_9BASI|nr:hypothetical protein MJO28_008820 [Puccinia striiformis f. sp. tritici]